MHAPWSLRTRFVLAALCCLMPLLGVVAYVLYQSLEHSKDQLVDTEASVAELISAGLQATLLEHQVVLDSLSRDTAIQSYALLQIVGTELEPDTPISDGQTRQPRPSDERVKRSADDRMVDATKFRPGLTAVFQTDATGEVISWRGGLAANQLQHDLTRPTERALDLGEVAISGRITVDMDQGDVIAIVHPIFIDGRPGTEPIGAIGALISVQRLEGTYLPFLRGDTMIMVVTADGQNVAGGSRLPEEERERFRAAYELNAATASRGVFAYDDANGIGRLAVATAMDFGGQSWRVLVSNPSPTTYGPNRILLQRGIAALIAATVATLILTLYLGDRTATPLRRLTAQAAELARGDFTVRGKTVETGGGGEVSQLSVAFQEMANRLATQVEELAASGQEREMQADELRDLNRRTIRLQEDERRRIAGEIHDAVSPLITGALYQSQAMSLSDEVTDSADRGEGLTRINHLLTRASEELHGVIFDLRPPDLDDLGVVAAIERYISGFQGGALSSFRFTVSGDEPPNLTPEIRVVIYRIVQESLHNVVRHAGADEASVAITSTEDELQVSIRDNGAGFDPERAIRPTSLGLLSMRERAAAIGATLDIESAPGMGTTVVMRRRVASAAAAEGAAYAQPTNPPEATAEESPLADRPAVAPPAFRPATSFTISRWVAGR